MKTPSFLGRFVFSISVVCSLSNLADASSPAQFTVGSDTIHRDFDSAVQRNVYEEPTDGGSIYRTNQFTILENNMHYLDAGEWKASEDVLEVFPEGVIGRRSPNQVIFSPRLGAPAVFDIVTRSGARIRGGVRSIVATDFSSGETAIFATVKSDARAELLDSDKVLYADSFEPDGLKASVIYVWRHNLFCQEVVLLEKPILPAHFNPETVRLEIITEFLDGSPVIREQEIPFGLDLRLRDHAVISFGDLAIVPGNAFPFDIEQIGKIDSDTNSVRVTKEWIARPDNTSLLIESVAWTEILPQLNELPEQQARANLMKRDVALAAAKARPISTKPTDETPPVQVAQSPYRPKGYVIDFTVFPDSALEYTLRSTNTYYIKTSFYTGNTVTFEPGTVIKFKNNANMLLYGPISFPSTYQTPVFTSREDDGFGQKIENVSGELTDSNSNGVPDEDEVRDPATHRAAQALYIYYQTSYTTIRNARIRWARRGVQYDGSANITHHLNDSAFERCDTGVYVNLSSGCVNFSNSTRQSVTNPVSGSGCLTGGVYPYYLDTVKFYSDVAGPGLSNTETNTVSIADVTGSIGTNYIVQMINGRIAVFDRTAVTNSNPNPWRVREADLFHFFAVTNGSDVYPKGYRVADPRVIYDPLSGRWIASAMDMVDGWTNNQVLLAISYGPDPVTLNSAPSATDTNWISANWKKYIVNLARTNLFTDYPTLGVDKYGIYIAASYTSNGAAGVVSHRVAALPKQALLNGTSSTLQPVNSSNIFSVILESGQKNIQAVQSFEANPTGDVAWFLSHANAYTNGSGYRPGKILYGGLKWNGTDGVFELQPDWFNPATGLEAPSALTYWDIPDDSAGGFNAPQKPLGTNNTGVPLRRGPATQVMSAVLQNSALWMCQHVGFNSSGSHSSASPATRSGIVWFKFQVNSGSPPTLSHYATPVYGRIYDTSSTPYWYYYPSLMANGQGDIIIGFSGSKSTEHIGAFYWGRTAAGL